MVNRKALAALVIVLWAAGFGWMVRRNNGGDVNRRLTEAALRVQPATFYYTLSYRGEKIGAAYSAIDTLVGALVSDEYYKGRFPVGDSLVEVSARLRARLSRGFRLTNVSIDVARDGQTSKASAFVQSDTTLVVTDRVSTDSAASHVFAVHSALLVPGLVGVALLLGDDAKPGRGERFVVFNPVTRKPEIHDVRIGSDSLFTVVDSASLAGAAGWTAAHSDTVRGWRLGGNTSGIDAWLDRDGRAIEATAPGGLVLRRTAYELAFEKPRKR